MKRAILVLGCGLIIFSQSALGQETAKPKHGGKIESKYDGFNYETVMRLHKMKVSCDGLKDKWKDACVSIDVTLHLDRKSTRLNSSHSQISYAVFCLKNKTAAGVGI